MLPLEEAGQRLVDGGGGAKRARDAAGGGEVLLVDLPRSRQRCADTRLFPARREPGRDRAQDRGGGSSGWGSGKALVRIEVAQAGAGRVHPVVRLLDGE